MALEATVEAAAAAIEEDFALLDGAREKIEYVVELGKDLPPLADGLKSETSRVRGCQSQVWLVADRDEKGRLRFEADSDAIIVKGLIALLMRLYDGRAPDEILNNPPDVFERIGLGAMLTPGRANGLYAMVNRIQQIAAATGRVGVR
ncbi:MAG: SufE family protein [Geminicoccaceae bacterium]|nr:SufE family protein [Geminicoccaceae bacterium]